MEHHPVAAAVATIITGRDPRRLGAVLTATARLRALLPGGPIEARGRDDVAARFHGFLADFDTVRLVESAGEAVGDRLVVHYRMHVTQGPTRWVCTQTAVCRFADGRLAVIDMLCSGFREIEDDEYTAEDDTAAPSAGRVG
jgi:SnoaL-like domain